MGWKNGRNFIVSATHVTHSLIVPLFLFYFAYTSPFPRARHKMVKFYQAEEENDTTISSLFLVLFRFSRQFPHSCLLWRRAWFLHSTFRRIRCRKLFAGLSFNCSISCYPSFPSLSVSSIDWTGRFSHRLKKQGSQTFLNIATLNIENINAFVK